MQVVVSEAARKMHARLVAAAVFARFMQTRFVPCLPAVALGLGDWFAGLGQIARLPRVKHGKCGRSMSREQWVQKDVRRKAARKRQRQARKAARR